MKFQLSALIVLILAVFTYEAHGLYRFILGPVWQSIARFSMNNGQTALAAYTAGSGAVAHIWDMVGSCTTANGEKVSAWDCAESVISSTFAVGFSLAFRYFTGAWWKRDADGKIPEHISHSAFSSLSQISESEHTLQAYFDVNHLRDIGLFNETHSFGGHNNGKIFVNQNKLKKVKEHYDWPIQFSYEHQHPKANSVIHVKSNLSHAVIYPLIKSNSTLSKRDGYDGYDEPNGEMFVESSSVGTIAQWNDVQDWEHRDNDKEVWSEWSRLLKNHKNNVWMGVSKGCQCVHTPVPKQATGCFAAFHRDATGYGKYVDFDDKGWCAKNHDNLCQC